MKSEKTIKISLLDFIKTGKLGSVETGQTREWITKHFPAPGHTEDMKNGISIWLYGVIEFYFFEGRLFQIWCDHLDYLPGKVPFILDLWKFKDYNQLTLEYMDQQLNKLELNYTLQENYHSQNILPDSLKLNITESTIIMYFENTQDVRSIQKYNLTAIGAESKS